MNNWKRLLPAALLISGAVVLFWLVGPGFWDGFAPEPSSMSTDTIASGPSSQATVGVANRTAPVAAGSVAAMPGSEARDANAIPELRTPSEWWHEPMAEETFARFRDWAERYVAAADAEKVALEAEGLALAAQRRAELQALIRSNPERALELIVPLAVRRALPAAIETLLEERISGRGDLWVLAALPEPGKEHLVTPVVRTVHLGGRDFTAYVYGWRLGEPTRRAIPLHGIAVDSDLAVSASPLRVLEPDEAAEARAAHPNAVCAICAQPANGAAPGLATELGGELKFFCTRAHAVQASEEIIARESGPPGPEATDEPEASAWTEGTKKLIFIRVDFPNLVGTPVADSTLITLMSNLNVFYTEMSYGRAGFYLNGQGSDFTPTFRMSQPAEYYGTNNYYNQLRTEARNAAAAAGYVLTNYQFDLICMGAVPGWSWAGLGYVGAAGVWLRNSFSTGVTGHELGHNFGLNHANFWDTGGQSVIGPGTSVEYGDSFDTMGSASAGNNHFNARFKHYLNWLTTNEVVTATTSGVYRIYTHDNPNAISFRGLRIVKNSQTNYWVEFRQKFTGNRWLMSGGGLRWAGNGNQKSHLLDTTPGSSDGKNDSALVIGRTFTDPQAQIHVTPLGKGGTSPESLDVQVYLGAFPDNRAPALEITASATDVSPGVGVTFTALASDPNGDALAYYWEFGDGNFGTNSPTAGKSWSTAGEYLVRCVVSDMKGGVASRWLVVTVGSPTTYRISGRVLTTNGPLQGVRVYVSTTRMAYTDSDGDYSIVGLPAGNYTVAASLEDYSFAPLGFTNPVGVGPSRGDVDFVATYLPYTPPSIVTQPLSQTVAPGTNVTFTVTATGSTPLYYQWRFNGANLSGATASSYTKVNVQPADAGNYSVVVSNLAGTATSANAVLTVLSPPVITSQPQSQTVIAGNTATFSVTATGSGLGYQWQHQGTNLPGATANSYSRLNAQPVHNGNYVVVITNSLGAVTSAPAVLTVQYALTARATPGGTVTRTPDLPSYAPGSVVTLTAESTSAFWFGGWSGDATGTNNPLSVIMTTNLVITANFVSPVPDLIVDNPQATFTGTWTVADSAGDQYGSNYQIAASTAQSASATATFVPNIAVAGRYDVYAWWPTISKGAQATPVLVSGSEGDLTVYLDQTRPSGGWRLLATGRLFAAGTNGFVRIANNAGGGKNVVADAVRWAYSPMQDALPPAITVQPTNLMVRVGDPAAFHVGATGNAPLGYQWHCNGVALAGETNPVLVLASVVPEYAGAYWVVVSNPAGAVTSAVATLTVLTPPEIVEPPVSRRVLAGSPVTFSVLATGSEPLTYQWFFNTALLPGATTALWGFDRVQPEHAGEYEVEVSNAVGTVRSPRATLVVSRRPWLEPGLELTGAGWWLRVFGTPGDVYEIEVSNDLQAWTVVGQVTNLTGTVTFADPLPPPEGPRFYRATLLLPPAAGP